MKYEHGTEVDVHFPLERWESGHVVVGEGLSGEVLTQRQHGRQQWLVHSFDSDKVRKRVEVLTELPEGWVLMQSSDVHEGVEVAIELTPLTYVTHTISRSGSDVLPDLDPYIVVKRAKQ